MLVLVICQYCMFGSLFLVDHQMNTQILHHNPVPTDQDHPNSLKQQGISLASVQMLKHVAGHKLGKKHQRNLERHDEQTATLQDLDSAPVQPTLPPARILGPLAQALADIQKNPDPRAHQHNYVNENLGVVDWGSVDDLDTQLEQPLEAHVTAQLAQDLAKYLQESENTDNSDDDHEERSDLDSSDSESGAWKDRDIPDIRASKDHHVHPDATESPWFPWPNKETCVLDILRHIPRCSFSKKQNTAIHWAMLALGLNNLPSDRVMDDIDKALQKLCGIQSIPCSGRLNHIYYTTDPR
ncbi:hypothetical protein FB45DRAFT_1126641 [Roridomyces roridus]|uniref:Uncharacterized protein n=1 Tax=Roridomyces roridus TaxID=1738132 RepID=A0AAD7FW90_9AGAR|nr:hypothetical protein FB45DRAFT_1126641 [Roridomyces roridus]